MTISNIGTILRLYYYFVREVSGIGNAAEDWQRAILENDGTTILYYENTVDPEEVLLLGSDRYVVTYEIDEATGACTVTNHVALTLPATGGTGTIPYIFRGLALIALAAVMYGYNRRRRNEGRAEGQSRN